MAGSKDIIVGLDIGTTKVCAIVGQLNENGKINVLGKGEAPSLGGVSKGMVANISKAEEAIRKAVEEAARQSNIEIHTVYVGIAGHHIKSMQHRGTLSRKNADDEIIEAELLKMEKDMEHISLSPGQEILHVIPQEYRIDDEDGIKDPLGRMGVRMECNYHIITGQMSPAKHIFMAVRRAGLEVADLIVEPLASAASVLSEPEIEAGIALIDIGGGTTDICIFDNGFIRHTASIGIGGDRITEDIREAFGILRDQAEYVKVNHGSCYPTESMKGNIVVVPGLPNRKPKEISLYAIAQVIQARMMDIIERVNYEIDTTGLRHRLGGGIVVTGGGSAMSNLTQLFEYEIGMDVHLGKPGQNLAKGFIEDVKSPKYATGLGLVMKGFAVTESKNLPANLPKAQQTEASTTPSDYRKPQTKLEVLEVVESEESEKEEKRFSLWPFKKGMKIDILGKLDEWIADEDGADDFKD